VALCLRDIHHSDKAALVRFHDRLSMQTRYRRYHAVKGDLTRGDLRYLTEVDGRRHVALVAEGADGEFAGVARVVAYDPHGDAAELAIVIADDEQDQGVGRLLADELLRRAEREGLRRIVLEVQADNHRALAFFQGLGARQLGREGGTCRLVIEP
jgi:ribosomal protein S18 acetylase RimI-like enzyme